MKHKDNPYLMRSGVDKPLHSADPAMYERIMSKWAALPTTIRSQVCQALGSPYPLWVWGDEKGFGFWTMNKTGARLAFHVGDPPPRPHMLLVVKIGDETNHYSCYWNHARSNLHNHRGLREKLIRTAFEAMASSGPKHREWIHCVINEIYPLSL